VIGRQQEHLVRLGLFFAVGTAAVCGAPMGCAPIWKTHQATVTIADAHYTLPSYWNVELRPRTPLCRQYENFHIVIVGRELFINGVLAYEAKQFDRVYVAYPIGVIVGGRIARIRQHKVLDDSIKILCS
jgi:hypothetical protein